MTQFFTLLMSSGTASGDGSQPASGSGLWTILMMVALFGVMYFVMIRPQRKKEKAEAQMRDSIQIGDEITTIGGIVGKVVTVKEDSIVVETGADRNKLSLMRWAIQTNNTGNARMEEEKAKLAEAQKKAKEEKRAAKKAPKERTKKDDVEPKL